MADADGDELHRAAAFDHFDHTAQMLFQIAAVVDREGRIIDWRTVGDHHQDAAVFGAGDQAVVRPEQGLAVDIFLKQPFAHHQAEVAAGMPPGFVSLFVNDVAQVVEATGHCRASGCQPVFTRLPAFPCAGGEAQNLGLHPAAFEGAGHDIGTDCGDTDRAAAHRARIVDQERDHRVAEFNIALNLVAQRASRRDNNTGEARGIEQPLFLVEIPTAILLCHQAALQAVGKARYRTLQP